MSVVKRYAVNISHDSGDPGVVDNAVQTGNTPGGIEDSPSIPEGIQIHLMDRLLLSGATVEVKEVNANGESAGLEPFDYGDFTG